MKELLNNLFSFEQKVTESMFQAHFGSVGAHLWQKYLKMDKNSIAFYKSLDSENADKFLDMIDEIEIEC